jgi:8-oxo-dGTP diphosphatase
MPRSSAKRYAYDYPRPAVTVDIVIVTKAKPPRALLVRRKRAPFAGMWALPGGFVNENEALDAAARRELREETGVDTDRIEQMHTFGNPGRDPRGHTVSVVYLARLDAKRVQPVAADDAAEVGWFRLDRLPALAFDHEKILEMARQRIG